MRHPKGFIVVLVAVALVCIFCIGHGSALMPSETKEELQQVQGENQKQQEEQDAQASKPSSRKSVGSVTAIGDSVMLGAAPAIQETIPDCVVDAKESRQVKEAIEIVKSLEQQDTLGDTVIIALGTNGPFDVSTGQDLIDQIGKDRTIYWVTVYGEYLQWQDESNDAINALAKQNYNVYIIDWAGAAVDHPEWLWKDGIHLRPEGQKAYAQLLLTSIS